MSRILLFYALNTSFVAEVALLHSAGVQLAKAGLALGPLPPYTPALVPIHNDTFARGLPPEAPIPPGVREALEAMACQLEQGKDILLMLHCFAPARFHFLARILREHAVCAKATVEVLIHVGVPLCLFEQRYREESRTPQVGGDIARQYANICQAIGVAQEEWGREHVSLYADTSNSPLSLPNPAAVENLFSWLQADMPKPLAHRPRHPLSLDSWEGRLLCRASEVRWNAWPPMDEGVFMDCLTRLDATWTSGPVSPRPLRNFLFREGENDRRQLETLLKVPLGSLDGPTWLLEEQEIEPPALSDEKAQAFVRTLPRDVAVPLLRRLSNDRILLNPTQKCLRSALKATSAEFQTLGEPLPPVELTVLTMTYNHEAYIRQCMDSVLAQQTSFAVRHLILDHHSQDATAEIITAYAEQHPSIQPVLLSRRVYWENIRGLFMRCRTRYVALCDGDDYFTNPHKLQKQVDYLEQHRDCALCVHPVHVVFDDAPEKNYIFPNPALLSRGYRGKYPLTQLFKGNFIQTNTVVYRWRFTFGLPRWFRADLCPGDWYWHILHAELGKIGFLPEVMSAYRRHKQALYYQTHVSVKEHRKVYGLPELEFYKVVNEHFHGKYFDQLASLANGVLANFLQLSVEKDDETLLTTASKQYPEFVKFFLDSLKIVKDADGHTQAIVER